MSHFSTNQEEGEFLYDTFSQDFIWGAATSAYQIEGAWDVDGKGPSVWDTFTHKPGNIYNNDTGDIACDGYHKIDEDIKLLKNLGVSHYRFSISWSRVLPQGVISHVNPLGLQYYKRLINKLKENNIEPAVKLYHFDMPQALQDIGGWMNRDVASMFGDYARLCFSEFGDDVKMWFTINQPHIEAFAGYGLGLFPPNIKDMANGVYQVGHNMLLAHATVWHIYDKEFRSNQQGRITINLDSEYLDPKTGSEADRAASNRGMQWRFGWMAHPLFKGDYPQIMKNNIAERSRQQGVPCRLPSFSEEEKTMVKGTADFVALNFYSAKLAAHDPELGSNSDTVWDYDTDQEVKKFTEPHWMKGGTDWMYCTPYAIRKFLVWIKDNYGNPEIIITENGFCCDGEDKLTGQEALNDIDRVNYLRMYINESLKASKIDGVNLKGYFVWSLMDNFEWVFGYKCKFGIHKVDFDDVNRPRVAKKSAEVYKQIVTANGFRKQ